MLAASEGCGVRCPSCASQDTYRVETAYERGTLSVLGGTVSDAFALRAARPDGKGRTRIRRGLNLLGWGAAVAAALLLGTRMGERDDRPAFLLWGAGLSALLLLLGIVTLLRGLSGLPADRVEDAAWKLRWICGRCGHVWTPPPAGD